MRRNVVRSFALLAAVALLAAACTSVGSVGIVTKSTADSASILRFGRAYKELGPAEGKACRFFVIAVVPFGDSTFSTAVEKALAEKGGDALLNVTTSSSLYGFIPVYNVLSFTCTTVKGIAVKFE
jgi:hypothetical protein